MGDLAPDHTRQQPVLDEGKEHHELQNIFVVSYSQFIQEMAFLYNHSPLCPRENVSFHAGFMASTHEPQHSRPSGLGL